jgi:hypothetical protein
MAHLLEVNFPTVDPQAAPGGNYENIPSSPRAFGGFQAEALGDLGQGVERVGVTGLDIYTEYQQKQNILKETELKTQFGNNRNKDYNAFMELRGQAAQDAWPEFMQRSDAERRQILDDPNLSLGARARLAPALTNLHDEYGRLTARHAASQAAGNERQVRQDSAAEYGAQAINMAVAGDEAGFTRNFSNFQAQWFNLATSPKGMGMNQEDAYNLVKRKNSALFGLIVDRMLAGGQTKRAEEFIDRFTGMDTEEGTLVTKGNIEKYKHIREGEEKANRASGAYLAPNTPVGRAINDAFEATGVPVAWLTAIARRESDFNPLNVTGQYKGLFQLNDEDWRLYGAGSIWNPRDNALAAAKKMKVEADQYAREIGHYPSLLEFYMLHQQGPGGARNHFANPDGSAVANMFNTQEGRDKGAGWAAQAIWGNIPTDSRAQLGFSSSPKFWTSLSPADQQRLQALTSGQFLSVWDAKINRAASPGELRPEKEAYDQIMAETEDNPVVRAGALAQHERIYRSVKMQRADQESSARRDAELKRADSAERLYEYYQNAWSNEPKLTASDIDLDKRLTETDKGHARAVYIRASKGEQLTPAVSMSNAKSLFDRMFNLAADDKNRIDSLDPIFAAAGSTDPKVGINRQEFDWLKKQWDDLRSSDGQHIAKLKKDFLAAVEPMIVSDIDKLNDPAHKARVFEFMKAVDHKVDEWRKKPGADLGELFSFDPKKNYEPTHFDLTPFRATMQGAVQQQLKRAPANAPPLEPNQDYYDYVQKHGFPPPWNPGETVPQYEARTGYGRRPTPTPAGAAVPQSR